MTDDPDRLELSDQERRVFAELEAELSGTDLDMGARLVHGGRPAVPLAVALIVLVVGAVVVLATFTRWLWVAVAGLLIMGFGLALLAGAVGTRVLTGSRKGPTPR